MERWETLHRQSRTGVLMQDRDLGELYSYLKLFRDTYKICEQETDQLLRQSEIYTYCRQVQQMQKKHWMD